MTLDIRCRIFAVLILLQALFLQGGCEASTFHEKLTELLSRKQHLVKEAETFPTDSLSAFYVLGGNQNNLKLKIKEVGRLYREGKARKVFFLHRKGITEYVPKLGRNYTNDEWAAEHLKMEGINADDIEFVLVPSAFFSTFAEARAVSSLARLLGIRRLILVTSRHHTARTLGSFSQCNRDSQLDLYIYDTEMEGDTFELIVELLKLSVYRLLVFPLDRLGIRF